MRQLKATGYMHNRLRMIVACFLVKDLLINWQKGEKYFMSTLIDGDLASNNGGWQWVSSNEGNRRRAMSSRITKE
jgi:deoxyribodipyrimidine photo-lyase